MSVLVATTLLVAVFACTMPRDGGETRATTGAVASGDRQSIPENADVTGTYNLVSVAGLPVPTPRAEGDQGMQIRASTLALKSDGTFVSSYDYGDTPGWPSHRDFRGTYAKRGADYVFSWEGAGQTGVKIDGPKLMMNNVGMVFVYLREGAQLPAEAARIDGAMEGERLPVLGKTGGTTQEQWMEWFGPQWSGNAQLWWSGAKPGDMLDLGINVQQAGTYSLAAQFTKANDYGIVKLYLDGKVLGNPIDLYNDGVIASGSIDLGKHDLDARVHKLTIEIAGADSLAIPAYIAGLDYVKLGPAGTPNAQAPAENKTAASGDPS